MIKNSNQQAFTRLHRYSCGLLIGFTYLLCSSHSLADTSGYIDLGRIFTSIEERQSLDLLRAQQLSPQDALIVNEDNSKVDPALRMQGLMMREDGQNVAWVNGKQIVSQHDLEEGFTINFASFETHDNTVKVDSDQLNFEIKPGQIWLKGENRVIESYAAIESNSGVLSKAARTIKDGMGNTMQKAVNTVNGDSSSE